MIPMSVQDLLDKVAEFSDGRYVDWSKVTLVVGLTADADGHGDIADIESCRFLCPNGVSIVMLGTDIGGDL